MKFDKHGIAITLKEPRLMFTPNQANIMINIERLGILSKMLGRDEESYDAYRTFTTAS